MVDGTMARSSCGISWLWACSNHRAWEGDGVLHIVVSGMLGMESITIENLPYLCPSDTLWVSSIIPERSRRGALATILRSDCSAPSF
jgi:hypothetical protein